MKIINILLFIFMASFSAVACEMTGSREEIALDLIEQKRLVLNSTALAKTIVLAKIYHIAESRSRSNQFGRASIIKFSVKKVIKGNARKGNIKNALAYLAHKYSACLTSDVFFEDQVKLGNTYILYINNGVITRAALTLGRSQAEIPFEEEVSIILNTAMPRR